MKQYLSLLLAVAAVFSISCTKELDNQNLKAPSNSHVVFKARVSNNPMSKATITPNGDDTVFSSAWEGTDAVNLYALSGTFDEEAQADWNPSTQAFEGDFSSSAPVVKEEWMYEAKYPYDDDGDIPFGSVREQKGNTYNSAYDIMYGTVSYTNAFLGQDNSGNVFVIPMTRLTGIAYFHITGGLSSDDVLSATLTVNSGNIAAETVAINGSGDAVVPTNGTNSITINFPSGYRPKANDIKLWFNVLPGTFSGMTLVIKTASKVASIASNKSITYAAGELNKVVLDGLNWVNSSSHSVTWSKESDWSETVDDGLGIVDGNYTVKLHQATGATLPAINASKNDARVYANGKVDVEYDGYAMTKIVFNLSAQGKTKLATITANVGTISTQSSSDETVTWTGKANSVTFTVGAKATYGSNPSDNGQLCFDSIDIETIDDGKSDPGLAFGEDSYTALTNAAFVSPTLTNPHSLGVTYSSTNTSVATVNASTGAISVVATGSTTIKAAYVGNATYRASTPSYVLNVEAPSIAATDADPASVSHVAGSEATFTVTANCTWEAVVGEDDDTIIDEITVVGNTVTVSFNANTEEEDKIATVIVRQTSALSLPASVEVYVAQNAKPGKPATGTMLWSEDFTGWSSWNNSASGATHVYGGGTVDYSSSTNCTYQNQNLAGGTAPEILITKSSDGKYIIKDIPISGSTSVTLFYNTNHDYCSLSASVAATVTAKSYVSSVKAWEITSIPADTETIDITITNTNSSNCRADNFILKAGTKTFQSLSFASPSVNWTIDTDCTIGSATAGQTISGANSTVTYTSSDPTVATVNSSTGAITPLKAGSTTITASAIEDGSNWAASASYGLTIAEAGGGSSSTATFTFADLGFSSGSALSTVSSDDDDNTDITLSFAQNDGANGPIYHSTGKGARLYNKNSLTVSGGTITSIVFTYASGYDKTLTPSAGSYSDGTWTGSAASVTLTNNESGQARIQKIVVTYE